MGLFLLNKFFIGYKLVGLDKVRIIESASFYFHSSVATIKVPTPAFITCASLYHVQDKVQNL